VFKRVFILSLFLLEISSGCKKESASSSTTTGVPNVEVNFSVDISNGLYANLATVGGYEYVSGGYDGIILFCNASVSYLAFDRGCPYDCTTNTKAIITVQTNGISAVCPVCGTTYSLYSGTVSKGPGSIALKQYNTSFNYPYISVSN